MQKTIVKKLLMFDHNITEDKLAGLLGISRTPVREALARLMADGILVRRQNVGIILKHPAAAHGKNVHVDDCKDVHFHILETAKKLAAQMKK